MICDICNIEMIKKDFKTRVVFYCESCFSYKQTEYDCLHEMKLFYFVLENGKKQLKNLCVKCYYREPKALPHSVINEQKTINEKSELSYKKYISLLDEDFLIFIGELRLKQNEKYYSVYKDYINSDQWKFRRGVILERDFRKCQICGGEAEQVHHLNYAHFTNEFDFELVALCKNCHMKEYHSESAKKITADILLQQKLFTKNDI